jgi:hypothetical protein
MKLATLPPPTYNIPLAASMFLRKQFTDPWTSCHSLWNSITVEHRIRTILFWGGGGSLLFFCLGFLGWGVTESTWYIAHYLAYCIRPGWWTEQSVEWVTAKTGVLAENLPLCPPQIPRDLTWVQTQDVVVGSQQGSIVTVLGFNAFFHTWEVCGSNSWQELTILPYWVKGWIVSGLFIHPTIMCSQLLASSSSHLNAFLFQVILQISFLYILVLMTFSLTASVV